MLSSQNSALSTPPTPLRGWITTDKRNYKGNKLGPYYSRTWKVGGKIKREYIKPADLERVRAACLAYKERRKRQSINTQKLTCMIGNLSFITRLCKRLRTGQVTQADLHFVAELNQKGYEIPGRPKLRTPAQHSAILSSLRDLRVKSDPAQHPIPNTQHPEKDFMYPFIAKSTESSPSYSTLNAQRSALRPSTLKKISAMLNKPIHDRYAKETEDEKWSRWLRAIKDRPKAPANVKRALPEGITRERIESDVTYIANLLSQKRSAPAVPQSPTRHPRTATKSHEPEKPPKYERPFPWEITEDDPRHQNHANRQREKEAERPQ